MRETVSFECKWVECAVREYLGLQTGTLCAEDLRKIKYLYIGDTQQGGLTISLSTKRPADPFAVPFGDQWLWRCYWGTELARLIEYIKNPSPIRRQQLIEFGFCDDPPASEWASNQAYVKAEQAWEPFQKSVFDYAAQAPMFETHDEWDLWFESQYNAFPRDLRYFTGVEVLGIMYGKFADFRTFSALPELRVLELCGTTFGSPEGIERLLSLKQFCCWLD